MKGKDVKRPSQKQTNPKDQELQFKEELKQKFGQNINYQSPNRYTLMENFNYRNPSYGVTVEYKFLHTIQDCGLLESSQLQYFMNLFRKAYPDVKLAAASCYFFGDLIVQEILYYLTITSQQAIQPQQQPIVFKLDWKRPTVQETPSQEQNKVQEAPKTTINKELPSSQNSQLQNKKSTEENQKLSQNNNLEQNEQQNKNSAQKNQSQVPHSEIVSIQQPLHSQVKQNKPQVQQNPQSEIISSNSQMQQITNSQDKSSQNQSQGYQHQQRKIKPKEELYNDYEISRHSQKQETHNNNQTEQINYQKRQHNNTQEIQANSPIQQSNVFEQPLSNQESQELSKEIQKQEQHQPDQIKKQDDEKIEKSLQSTQSQVIQQKYEGDTSNKKQTYAASEIISSREDSTQVKQQSTQKPKRQYQDITQAPQNSNQISVNQDNSQVEAGQIKQTFQQDQKEVPIVQAPEIQDQAKPVNIVEPPKQEPAKQYHFQISSIIEQNPQKEVLSTSQLGSLIKQFAEINNLSDDQLKHQDYWFFPINQQQAHWVSVVVELQTKVIYYFDSYYEKIDPLITKGINSILDYFNLNSKVFKIKEIYNKQENCYDCGIFLLLSLLYTLRRKEYDYNQKLINKYRESILYQLAVIGAQADIDKDFLEKLIS